MQAPIEPGFEVRGRFYPFPTTFRVCDPILVYQVTGWEFQQFADSIAQGETPDGGADNPIAVAGLIAVAIWQKFPDWRRDQVVRYVESLGQNDVKIVGLGYLGPESEGDGPLETETLSPLSSDGSNSESEIPSPPESQSSSGPGESLTGFPE
jgi:hypothetical protein